MIHNLARIFGAFATVAVCLLVSGTIASADPPRPVVGREPAREAVRENRAAVRDARIDRRAYRVPGDLGLRLGATADRGLAIANLATGGVFYGVGLRPGDYIVSVNGHRILSPGDFDRYLYAAGPDQPAQIIVWRNGSELTLTVQPNILYTDNYGYVDDLAYLGFQFDPQYANELYVSQVAPNSWAYRAGFRVGDVIKDWNGQRIRTPQEFGRIIHDQKPGRVAFNYMRAGETMRGNVAFEPIDRTARRDTPATGPTEVAPPTNSREPNPQPTLPVRPREPIPVVTPPGNPRVPIPTVPPPANPREPMPKVTPPASPSPTPAPRSER